MPPFFAIGLGLVGAALAFANGANDNYKGVATLEGSATTSYRRALGWATVTTLAGSLAAVWLARGLLAAFSGKGLVPAEVVAEPSFAGSVGLAAGLTVLLATRIGFPISTTHALIGGLVGAGLLASEAGVDTARLASGFALPLAVSPLLAIAGAVILYPPLRFLRKASGVSQETCVCVGEKIVGVVPGSLSREQAMASVALPVLETGTEASCAVRYDGNVLGLSARRVLDLAHFLSAGAVCFARGLNDTPKIAALLLISGALTPGWALVTVGTSIAVGGWLYSRRVANTMAHRVTAMNPGQGFTANLVTATLVIGASRFGVPVSTTHVSCGSLFGIGAVTRQARWSIVGRILAAWAITLPVSAALAAGIFLAISGPGSAA